MEFTSLNTSGFSETGMHCCLRRLVVSLLLMSMILPLSCAKRQVARKAEPELYTGPVTIEVLKQSVGFRDVRSIKSLVDVKIFNNGETAGSLSGVFGYKSPGNTRVSLFGPFGLTVTELLITETILQMHVPSKALLYEGESTGISFSSLLDDRFMYTKEEEGKELRLYVFREQEGNHGLFAKYIFDKKNLLNRKIYFYRDGHEIAELNFNNYNGRVPEQTIITFQNGSSIQITLIEPEYDAEIPDKYFRQIPHKDNKILPFQDLFNRFAPMR